MQSLIRSKSAGVTGGRGTAGAGPGRDLHYGSRGVSAAPTYRRPRDLGPYEPCPSTPRVRIVDSVETTPEIGAREEPRRSRAWRTPELKPEEKYDIREEEDLTWRTWSPCASVAAARHATSAPPRRTLRSLPFRQQWRTGPALPEARVTQASGRGRRGYGYGPQPSQAVGIRGALRWLSSCLPSESEEIPAPTARAHTAPEPALKHDAEGLERPARATTAPVPRHTGPEMDAIGDTPMGDESVAPGTAGCAGSDGKHAECHCEHVSFLMGKYPKMGMDAIVHRLDSLDNAKDGLEEDVAGILDDQSAAERDMAELRAERDWYRENLELALEKQQRVVDSLLRLVENMSGRLKRLEELQPTSRVRSSRQSWQRQSWWSGLRPSGAPWRNPWAALQRHHTRLRVLTRVRCRLFPCSANPQCSGSKRHRLGPCGKGTQPRTRGA